MPHGPNLTARPALCCRRRAGCVCSTGLDTVALIIEDDNDAEFRYDRTSIGALQGLAPEHVVYGSSASKVLSPALRLGWLAAPEHLLAELLPEKALADFATETLGQLTLARFIDGGDPLAADVADEFLRDESRDGGNLGLAADELTASATHERFLRLRQKTLRRL